MNLQHLRQFGRNEISFAGGIDLCFICPDELQWNRCHDPFSDLPPYYHEAVVGEKHPRRNAATIRTAGREHLKAGLEDLAFVDRALFHGAHKESAARLIHRHALGVYIRAVEKRVQDRRRIRLENLLRVAVRRHTQ